MKYKNPLITPRKITRSKNKLFYKLRGNGVIEMEKNEKATQELNNFCIDNGESFVINTKRGAEVAHTLTSKQFEKVLKGDVLNLFLDACLYGFAKTEMTAEFYKDIVDHLGKCDAMSIVLHGNKNPHKFGWRFLSPEYDWKYNQLGAFCTYTVYEWQGKKIVYFGGIMVYPKLQDLNYGCSLIRKAMETVKADYLALRTQNPQMYASFAKVCGDTYPNGKKIPKDVEEIGNFLAREVLMMSDYDNKTMMEKGTYGKCLYGKIPAPKNGVEEVFKNLNPFNGDSVLAIAKAEKRRV